MQGTLDTAKLIDLIYAASVHPEAWPAALTGIALGLQARAVGLAITDPEGSFAPFVVAPRTAPEWLAAYRDRWASTTAGESVHELSIGEIHEYDHPGVPRLGLDRSPFYNESWIPQRVDLVLLMLAAEDATAASRIGLYRYHDDGRSERNRQHLLSLLGPHLRRAVSLNLRLARTEMQRESTAEMLNRFDHGALLVDAAGRLLFANVAAEEILKSDSGMRVREGRLATWVASETAALRAMIAGARNNTGNRILALECPDGRRVTVEVIPVRVETAWLPQRPAAIVFVKDPNANALPSLEQVQLLFELTPAQAGLALELLSGGGIPAAAKRLGVSRSTARTHLHELFQKTGTNRQADLVRVILQQKSVGAAARHDDPGRGAPGKRRLSWQAKGMIWLSPLVGIAGDLTLWAV